MGAVAIGLTSVKTEITHDELLVQEDSQSEKGETRLVAVHRRSDGDFQDFQMNVRARLIQVILGTHLGRLH